MSIERFIVQNIERNKLHEGLEALEVNETNTPLTNPNNCCDDRPSDLLDTYNTMVNKGYNELPESTAEKRAFRAIEESLIELGTPDIEEAPMIESFIVEEIMSDVTDKPENGVDDPGEFLE